MRVESATTWRVGTKTELLIGCERNGERCVLAVCVLPKLLHEQSEQTAGPVRSHDCVPWTGQHAAGQAGVTVALAPGFFTGNTDLLNVNQPFPSSILERRHVASA